MVLKLKNLRFSSYGPRPVFRVATLTKILEILLTTTIDMWGMLNYVFRHQESIEIVILYPRPLLFELGIDPKSLILKEN